MRLVPSARCLAPALLLLLCLPRLLLADEKKPPAAAWIDPFGGWAGPGGGVLYARVHQGLPPAKPKPAESSFTRLEQTISALERNALAGATVAISGLPGILRATANDHGMLTLALPPGLPRGPLTLQLTVVTPGWSSPTTPLVVDVSDDGPALGILSDIDDTVTDTGVTHQTKMLLGTFFHSEFEVQVFPGVATVLGGLVKGREAARRSLYFLSGSPWGLHERLTDAFALAGLPSAVTLLRSLSAEKLDAYQFKLPHLQQLFAAFPHRKWLLFGDSGEKDPEVYATMRLASPSQIESIYIHNVTQAKASDPRFAGMTLFSDWSELVPLLQKGGYLPPAATVPAR